MTLVYLSCAGAREIHSFALNSASGDLDPFEIMTVPGGAEPSPANMPLAFGPGGTRLYAALRAEPFLAAAFAVEPGTGRLSPINTATLAAPMAYISVADHGRILLAASYKEGRLSVSRLGPGGAVQGPPAQLLVTPPKAHCIISDLNGVVYATTVEGDAILVYRLDGDAGRLVPISEAKLRPGSGPRHLAFHPELDVLYCVNELAGTLATCEIEPATGGLRVLDYAALTPPGFTGNARAADLHLTPDGRFAYASVRNTNSLVAFRVAADTGHLSLVGLFPAEESPRGFNVDPTGRWLLCAGQAQRSLGVYEIDQATGALTFRHRRTVGDNPNWVEMLPSP